MQAYTHPLWFFLISSVYAVVTGLLSRFFLAARLPWTVMIVSIACSVGAVWLFARRIAHDWWAAVAGVLLLTFSRAFTDYATSGLEEALTIELVGFLYGILPGARAKQTKAMENYLCSLGVLTVDIVCCMLCGLVLWNPSGRRLALLPRYFAGSLWENFSLFLYGFLPNNIRQK